jgi:hypothetical protein
LLLMPDTDTAVDPAFNDSNRRLIQLADGRTYARNPGGQWNLLAPRTATPAASAADLAAPIPGVVRAPNPTGPGSFSGTGGAGTVSGFARQPIAAPSGAGGVPLPDMSTAYQQAFSHLPIDQAIKAVQMATKFQGQRGYQADIQSGTPAASALAKWSPLLFGGSATGQAGIMRAASPQMPRMLDPSVVALNTARAALLNRPKPAPQITPYQQGEQDDRRAKFAWEQKQADRQRQHAIYEAALKGIAELYSKNYSDEPPDEKTATPQHQARWKTQNERMQKFKAITDKYESGDETPENPQQSADSAQTYKAGTKVKNADGKVNWLKSDGSLPDGWTVVQ